jgi:hypothetical protein
VTTKQRAIVLAAIGMTVCPAILFSAYLVLSRWPRDWAATSAVNYLFLGLCHVPGSVLVARSPIVKIARVAILMFWLPLSCLALEQYSLLFVGIWFNRWS